MPYKLVTTYADGSVTLTDPFTLPDGMGTADILGSAASDEVTYLSFTNETTMTISGYVSGEEAANHRHTLPVSILLLYSTGDARQIRGSLYTPLY